MGEEALASTRWCCLLPFYLERHLHGWLTQLVPCSGDAMRMRESFGGTAHALFVADIGCPGCMSLGQLHCSVQVCHLASNAMSSLFIFGHGLTALGCIRCFGAQMRCIHAQLRRCLCIATLARSSWH